MRSEGVEQAVVEPARCYVTFLSVHHLMEAEEVLLAAGLAVKVVPVPRELSADCGAAFEIPCDEADLIKTALVDHQLRFEAVLRLDRTS